MRPTPRHQLGGQRSFLLRRHRQEPQELSSLSTSQHDAPNHQQRDATRHDERHEQQQELPQRRRDATQTSRNQNQQSDERADRLKNQPSQRHSPQRVDALLQRIRRVDRAQSIREELCRIGQALLIQLPHRSEATDLPTQFDRQPTDDQLHQARRSGNTTNRNHDDVAPNIRLGQEDEDDGQDDSDEPTPRPPTTGTGKRHQFDPRSLLAQPHANSLHDTQSPHQLRQRDRQQRNEDDQRNESMQRECHGIPQNQT